MDVWLLKAERPCRDPMKAVLGSQVEFPLDASLVLIPDGVLFLLGGIAEERRFFGFAIPSGQEMPLAQLLDTFIAADADYFFAGIVPLPIIEGNTQGEFLLRHGTKTIGDDLVEPRGTGDGALRTRVVIGHHAHEIRARGECRVVVDADDILPEGLRVVIGVYDYAAL